MATPTPSPPSAAETQSVQHQLQLFNDPNCIIYTSERALALIESDVLVAEAEPAVEHRLYPLISRIVSDLCLVVYAKDNDSGKVLQAHNQAYFSYIEEVKNSGAEVNEVIEKVYARFPDCAAIVFAFDPQSLKPAFWLEGKALSSEKFLFYTSWREELDHWRQVALQRFEEVILQVRDQAKAATNAFELDGPEATFDVVILQGIFWSLLTFTNKDEKKMLELEKESHTYSTPKAGRVSKRMRPGVQDPHNIQVKRLERLLASRDEDNENILRDVTIPKLHYLCETLVLGESKVERLNPLFLKFLSDVMAKQGFDMQPSWLSVPPDFNVDEVEKIQLDLGNQALRRAYSKLFLQEQEDRQDTRAGASIITPSPKGDSDYDPGDPHYDPFRNGPISPLARRKRVV